MKLSGGDEALATAILDRLLHRAHVLNIKGRSYRPRDFEDALKLANACPHQRRPAGREAIRKTGCRLI